MTRVVPLLAESGPETWKQNATEPARQVGGRVYSGSAHPFGSPPACSKVRGVHPRGEGKSTGAPPGLPNWPRPCGGATGGSWGARAPATLMSPSCTHPLPGGGSGHWSLNTPPPGLPPPSDRALPGPQPSDQGLLWEEEPWLSADGARLESKSYRPTDRCFPGGREEATCTR